MKIIRYQLSNSANYKQIEIENKINMITKIKEKILNKKCSTLV